MTTSDTLEPVRRVEGARSQKGRHFVQTNNHTVPVYSRVFPNDGHSKVWSDFTSLTPSDTHRDFSLNCGERGGSRGGWGVQPVGVTLVTTTTPGSSTGLSSGRSSGEERPTRVTPVTTPQNPVEPVAPTETPGSIMEPREPVHRAREIRRGRRPGHVLTRTRTRREDARRGP